MGADIVSVPYFSISTVLVLSLLLALSFSERIPITTPNQTVKSINGNLFIYYSFFLKTYYIAIILNKSIKYIKQYNFILHIKSTLGFIYI